MHEKYPRIYGLLKEAGHSAAKALEIVIDAKRGDRFARGWIGLLFKYRR